jgi:hypothetical protein
MAVLHYPGRVLVWDRDAESHPAHSVHALELADGFLSVWTKGQVPPFRTTDHDPATYHVGDEKLSWVDECYVERRFRVMGYKQHFHVATVGRAGLADAEPFREHVHPALWAELESVCGVTPDGQL